MDPQGNLLSVGIVGAPNLWQAKTASYGTLMTPTEAGFSPEEAAKMSGPVLVEPPNPPDLVYRYRYYQTGQNNCQSDLKKILADRVATNATSPAPYCTDNPPAPTAKGSALLF
jgi:hypothetical protein